MTIPVQPPHTGAPAAAAALPDVSQASSTMMSPALEAIEGFPNLVGEAEEFILPSLKARITALKGELHGQSFKISKVMERLAKQEQRVQDRRKEIDLRQIDLDKQKAALADFEKELRLTLNEHADLLSKRETTKTTLQRTQNFLDRLAPMDLPDASAAAAGPSGEESSSKRVREDVVDEPEKAARIEVQPQVGVPPVHDLKLLGEIFPPGTKVIRYGAPGTIIKFNPEAETFTISLDGLRTKEVDVTPRNLRFLPEKGQICLVRENLSKDPLQHYYLARIIDVTTQSQRLNNPKVDIEWIDYPKTAPVIGRSIVGLDALLPIDSGHPIFDQLLKEEVVDPLGQTGTGYFLGKK